MLLGKHSGFSNFDATVPTLEEESDDEEEPEEATVTAEEMEEWKAWGVVGVHPKRPLLVDELIKECTTHYLED